MAEVFSDETRGTEKMQQWKPNPACCDSSKTAMTQIKGLLCFTGYLRALDFSPNMFAKKNPKIYNNRKLTHDA